jgi:hypothetical protein
MEVSDLSARCYLTRGSRQKDARASCDTMVARSHVNHVPVLTGGVGRQQLEHYTVPRQSCSNERTPPRNAVPADVLMRVPSRPLSAEPASNRRCDRLREPPGRGQVTPSPLNQRVGRWPTLGVWQTGGLRYAR